MVLLAIALYADFLRVGCRSEMALLCGLFMGYTGKNVAAAYDVPV